MIRKLAILNYRCFEAFTLECNPDLNIIVGDNETGKSTVLEAINLALTKKLGGRYIDSELSPHLFNKSSVTGFLERIRQGESVSLPNITIELYLADEEPLQPLKGTNKHRPCRLPWDSA